MMNNYETVHGIDRCHADSWITWKQNIVQQQHPTCAIDWHSKGDPLSYENERKFLYSLLPLYYSEAWLWSYKLFIISKNYVKMSHWYWLETFHPFNLVPKVYEAGTQEQSDLTSISSMAHFYVLVLAWLSLFIIRWRWAQEKGCFSSDKLILLFYLFSQNHAEIHVMKVQIEWSKNRGIWGRFTSCARLWRIR